MKNVSIRLGKTLGVKTFYFPSPLLALLVAILLSLSLCTKALAFTHPGIPLTTSDLDTIQANLNVEPWKSGYAAFVADSHSQLSYSMLGPFATVSRNPDVNLYQWREDMMAIWKLARMWYFTRDNTYAQKAHDILIAWATTQTSFSGTASNLDLGDYAFRFAGGADILRGTWPGWTAADTTAVKAYFANVLQPGANPWGESMSFPSPASERKRNHPLGP